MTKAAEKSADEATAVLEAQATELIAMCGGSVMQALRTALVANTFLEAEIERLRGEISVGFVRRKGKVQPH